LTASDSRPDQLTVFVDMVELPLECCLLVSR